MNISQAFIRFFFICISILFMTTYTSGLEGGPNLLNICFGVIAGSAFGLILISFDSLIRRLNLRTITTSLIGLLLGFCLGEAILLIVDATLKISNLPPTNDLGKTLLFLPCLYIGMTLTGRAGEEFYVSLPFIRLKPNSSKKKDILVEWSILLESRIIDLATSGLLDDHLIVPRCVLKELYIMLDSTDEVIQNKAKRCLEVFKKLEGVPSLELRFSDTDFPEIKDPAAKLIQLARLLDANILTADPAKFQQYAVEGIRIINIHLLSNVLKPITGEQLAIKIQRYGKEPRQGVGYLEDGTMVVVNGGAEFIGETIKSHVLSVKHTASGRMIFCNVSEDSVACDTLSHQLPGIDMESIQKNYYPL